MKQSIRQSINWKKHKHIFSRASPASCRQSDQATGRADLTGTFTELLANIPQSYWPISHTATGQYPTQLLANIPQSYWPGQTSRARSQSYWPISHRATGQYPTQLRANIPQSYWPISYRATGQYPTELLANIPQSYGPISHTATGQPT